MLNIFFIALITPPPVDLKWDTALFCDPFSLIISCFLLPIVPPVIVICPTNKPSPTSHP